MNENKYTQLSVLDSSNSLINSIITSKEIDIRSKNFDTLQLMKYNFLLSVLKSCKILIDIFIRQYELNKVYAAFYGNFICRYLVEKYVSLSLIDSLLDVNYEKFSYRTTDNRTYSLFEHFKENQNNIVIECLSLMYLHDLIKTKTANFKESNIFIEFSKIEILKYLYKDKDIDNILIVIKKLKEDDEKKKKIDEVYSYLKKDWDGTTLKNKVNFINKVQKELGKEENFFLENAYEIYCNSVHGNILHSMDVLSINPEDKSEFERKSLNHIIVINVLVLGIFTLLDKFCDNKNSEEKIAIITENLKKCPKSN